MSNDKQDMQAAMDKDFDRLVYQWFQESTIAHHIEENGRHLCKRNRFVAEKAAEWGAQWQSQQAQGEAAAWQFYQDGKWYTGMNTNNHRENTEAAGYPVRDLYAHPPAPVPSNGAFTLLMRDICEQEPFDPDHERAVCVNYDWLYDRVKQAFDSPAPVAVPDRIEWAPGKIMTREQAVRIFNVATDKEDPYWIDLVEDFYDEETDTWPSVFDVFAAIGVTKAEYMGVTGADNVGDWPSPPTDKDHQQSALFRAHNGGED